MIRGAPASKKNPLPHPTSTVGPMARNPMDCAMLLETMAGKNKFDAHLVLDKELSLETTRIGWLGDWGRQLPFEDGVLDICRFALGLPSPRLQRSLSYAFGGRKWMLLH
jgi:Asp-tRNA(Asn)/Glu-tRNA(Gln) amidotransferase A subunit family amidase